MENFILSNNFNYILIHILRSVVSISETIDEIGELEESHPVTDHPINKLKMDLIGQVYIDR